MRLSPTLRTLTVKHVSREWKANLNDFVRAWAKVGQLSLPALERAHIRLSDSVDNKNYYFSHCRLHTCGRQAQTADHDTWKRKVEESMPSAWKDKKILVVEVVKGQTNFRLIQYISSRFIFQTLTARLGLGLKDFN